MFDKKFKLAKEDATDLRGALKRLEEKDFDEEIEVAKEELSVNTIMIYEQKSSCEDIKKKITKSKKQLSKLQTKIGSIPAEIIDINEVKNDLEKKRKLVVQLESDNVDNKSYIEGQKELLNNQKVLFLEL